VDEARKHIPEHLRLVQLNGWTLGGVYLARYTSSPAGQFDEMVVLAGLVWNGLTSCAWAQRVYVNSREARDHGVAHVGLPSRLATFKPCREARCSGADASSPSWWNAGVHTHGGARSQLASGQPLVVSNMERGKKGIATPVAQLLLPEEREQQSGPRLSLQLPNYSGGTAACPQLLKYTCQLKTRVRLLHTTQRLKPVGAGDVGHMEDVSSVLHSQPLLTLAFDDMHMSVEQPQIVRDSLPLQSAVA
jgi:hypothetical protein